MKWNEDTNGKEWKRDSTDRSDCDRKYRKWAKKVIFYTICRTEAEVKSRLSQWWAPGIDAKASVGVIPLLCCSVVLLLRISLAKRINETTNEYKSVVWDLRLDHRLTTPPGMSSHWPQRDYWIAIGINSALMQWMRYVMKRRIIMQWSRQCTTQHSTWRHTTINHSDPHSPL